MTKEQLKDQMHKLAAEIGKIEIQRNTGTYISGNLLASKYRELSQLQKAYKKFVITV